MSKAPAPDAGAAMCPGAVVKGGGGGAGGSGGDGKGDGDGTGDGANGEGDGTNGDGASGDEGCGDPICPITGRMFLPIFDFGFGGPMPLRWVRHYSSRRAKNDGEVGHGWSHTFGWRIRPRRRRVELYDDENRLHDMARAAEMDNGLGWGLREEGDGFTLRTPDGVTRRFGAQCGTYHHLERVADRNGNTIEVHRDAKARLTGLTDSAGRKYRAHLDDRGRIVAMEVALDDRAARWMRTATYAYDDEGDLVSFTDAEDFTFRYRYDRHLMVEHELPTGLSYCYRYDGRTHRAYCVESWGEYIGQQDPALADPPPARPARGPDRRRRKGIHHVKLTYDKATRYTEVRTSLGGTYHYFGDALGRVIKRVEPNGGVSDYKYGPDGTLVSEVQPDNTARELQSDGAGLDRFVMSDGGVLTSFVDPATGEEVKFDEAQRAVVRRTFDARGNATMVRHADGTTEEYESDSRGLLLRSVDRLGVVTRYVHDAMGNAVESQRTGQAAETMEYDYLGRKTAHVDIYGARTEWRWDRRSEVVEKRYADGTSTRWVRNGLRYATETHDRGVSTRVHYGGLHWPYLVEHADGTTLEHRYDTEGNEVLLRNGRGETYEKTVDHTGRIKEEVTFEGHRWTYGYGVDDRILWRKGPLLTETRAYDKSARLTEVELDDEHIALEYDAAQRKLRIDNAVPIETTFNAAGNPEREDAHIHALRIYWNGGHADALVGDVGLPVLRERGPDGEVDRIIAGDQSPIVFTGTATLNRLTYLGDRLVLRRVFNGVGQLVGQWLAPNDPTLSEHEKATSADGGILWWSTYAWQGALLKEERRSDGRTITLEHDPVGRIARRTVVDAHGNTLDDERVRYDAFGTPQVDGARYDAHGRPTEVGGAPIEYDAAGQTSRRGDQVLHWSAAGELTSVVERTKETRYLYDGRGRRVAKRVFQHGELVRDISYQWSNDCVLHEVDHTRSRSRTYLRDEHSFAPLGHVDLQGESTDVVYYLRSPIGFPLAAVDDKGAVVWQAEPTVYGQAQPSVSTSDVDVRFPNQHHDPDTGLVYNFHRWFDPATGLFLTPDPLLLEGNVRLREYVPDPTTQDDPQGYAPLDFSHTSTSLLKPGPYATKGTADIPGYIDAGKLAQQQGSFPKDVHRAIDNAGFTHGCHSCGSKDPDPEKKYGAKHFTPDHQPPVSQQKALGLPAKTDYGGVRLYPHCRSCSEDQKHQQSNLANRKDRRDEHATVAHENWANQILDHEGDPHPIPSPAKLKEVGDGIKKSSPTPNNGWPDKGDDRDGVGKSHYTL